MIYYAIRKTKDISGNYAYSLDLFSSKEDVLLFVEKEQLRHKSPHQVAAAGSIDLETKTKNCSGWQPELGDSMRILKRWARP